MINNLTITDPDTPSEEREFGYPVRHRSRYPFIPTISVSPRVGTWNQEIFKLDAELDRFILTEQDYFELISEAFASNIHISTRMEGNPLPFAEVKRLTKGTFRCGIQEKMVDFPSQEIMNHIGVYLLDLSTRQFDVSLVKEIHEFLLKGDPSSSPGEFRHDFRSVYSDEGEELFITCPPEHIEREMGSLLKWVRTTGPGHYPVIAGTILFHEFESIHPFSDGNGRCGRTLFHLYLQTHGLPNSKLCLIEQEMVSDNEKYYDLLARTDFYQDYGDLLTSFTKSVKTSYEKAVERYKEKDLLSKNLDEISKRLLVKAKELDSDFSLNDARRWFDNTSDFRIRSRLRELVDMGAIWESGETRGKRYRFADPMRTLMDSVRRLFQVISDR
ncbi:MAG TPA: Fic family protein [Euryarchaeota archaeon]|nr:Fic family protein [Euryarchaeota archaeon]